MGVGPMTGRGTGYCAGYAVPGYANAMPGRGFGMGWGGGWGRFRPVPAWGYGPYAEPITREQEVASLKAQADWLKGQLDTVNQCLAELEKEE